MGTTTPWDHLLPLLERCLQWMLPHSSCTCDCMHTEEVCSLLLPVFPPQLWYSLQPWLGLVLSAHVCVCWCVCWMSNKGHSVWHAVCMSCQPAWWQPSSFLSKIIFITSPSICFSLPHILYHDTFMSSCIFFFLSGLFLFLKSPFIPIFHSPLQFLCTPLISASWFPRMPCSRPLR